MWKPHANPFMSLSTNWPKFFNILSTTFFANFKMMSYTRMKIEFFDRNYHEAIENSCHLHECTGYHLEKSQPGC
jgi:hypothetical protein